MVETVLTPPHANPFEALLDEPFASTLHHPTPQRQALFFILGIVDVLAMPFQIGGCFRGVGLLFSRGV
jgi:hypothetical protein